MSRACDTPTNERATRLHHVSTRYMQYQRRRAAQRGWTRHGVSSRQDKQAPDPLGRLPDQAPFSLHAAPRPRHRPSVASRMFFMQD